MYHRFFIQRSPLPRGTKVLGPSAIGPLNYLPHIRAMIFFSNRSDTIQLPQPSDVSTWQVLRTSLAFHEWQVCGVPVWLQGLGSKAVAGTSRRTQELSRP